MPTDRHPHEVLLDQIKEEFSDIFRNTSQGVYIYMDDPHWICNDRFATMLGYASAAELHALATASPFLDIAIPAEDQERVVNAYMKSVNNKSASSIAVTWKKKGGATLKTETIFVPISYQGTALTIHFVTPI
jgi:PAS domain-containing protein